MIVNKLRQIEFFGLKSVDAVESVAGQASQHELVGAGTDIFRKDDVQKACHGVGIQRKGLVHLFATVKKQLEINILYVVEGYLKECCGVVQPRFFVHEILKADVESIWLVGFPKQEFGIMLCLKFGIPGGGQIENPFWLVHHAYM